MGAPMTETAAGNLSIRACRLEDKVKGMGAFPVQAFGIVKEQA
jgi:hypothetical protein